MPKKRTLDLTDEQMHELVDHRDHNSRPYVRERCAALIKVSKGMSARQIAKNGLLKPRDPATVCNWLDIYEAELRERLRYPPSVELSPERRNSLNK